MDFKIIECSVPICNNERYREESIKCTDEVTLTLKCEIKINEAKYKVGDKIIYFDRYKGIITHTCSCSTYIIFKLEDAVSVLCPINSTNIRKLRDDE